jgi:hypothetical protein
MTSPVTSEARPEPVRAEVDGVPVFWTEAPDPFTGALMFRVGRADEMLPTSGITHLVEHLALYPVGRQPYDYNGVVEENIALFWASGRREEVLDFLGRCSRQVGELPLDRLEDEKRVLRVEGARVGGLYGDLLSYRYGAQGYGLMGFNELGLRSLEAGDVADWSARFFSSGNAVAWLSGPPDGLSLTLPVAGRQPPPEPEPLSGLELPAQSWHRGAAVLANFEGRRSSALSTAMAIAADRVHERLRREEGVAYSPGGAYNPLTADRVYVVLSSDCRENDAVPVRDGVLAILDDLADHGPTEGELEWHRSMVLRQRADPHARLQQLDYYARRELIGGDPLDDATVLREIDELTPESVATAVQEVLPSMLVSVPAGTPRSARPGLAEYRAPDPTDSVAGTRFPPNKKWRQLEAFDEVTIGSAGLTYRARPGAEPFTIRFEDCVAAVEAQESSLDLIARTGSYVRISPERFENGVLALDTVRRALPADVFVPMDEANDRVQGAAARFLSDDRRAPVAGDLDALAGVLAPAEEIRALAEAHRQRFQGLLAVTDRRLMFIFTGAEEDFREAPLDSISNVQTKGMLAKRLALTAADERLEFTDIWPRERLSEIVELVTPG